MTVPILSKDKVTSVPAARLLEIDDLQIGFPSARGLALAVDGVSFHVDEGESIAIVGESGSGKSLTLRAIMGLLDRSGAVVSGGQIRFGGENLLAMPAKERRAIRGGEIALVSQDVLGSLHPLYTVGWQIAETIRIHDPRVSAKEARKRAVALLDRVGIPAAERRVDDYPHRFSGGMRQRVAIAMALANNPRLLLADEPTTAVDATIQAQLLNLLRELQLERNMALVMVTHDLAVVTDIATSVGIMYAGHLVEWGPVAEVFTRPAHPYTAGLLRAHPSGRRRERLQPIPGSPPAPGAAPSGCVFHPRCPFARDLCRTEAPDVIQISPTRTSACYFTEEVLAGGWRAE